MPEVRKRSSSLLRAGALPAILPLPRSTRPFPNHIGKNMSVIGNILWIILGGWISALLWLLAGVLACLSIVGLPWGRACFVMAGFVFMPFGYESISRDILYGRGDIGTGAPGMLGNALWFIFAGLWIALGHVAMAVCLGLSIVGIPFAWQHLKLAELALFPIGKTVVPCEVAAEARRRRAAEELDRRRSA